MSGSRVVKALPISTFSIKINNFEVSSTLHNFFAYFNAIMSLNKCVPTSSRGPSFVTHKFVFPVPHQSLNQTTAHRPSGLGSVGVAHPSSRAKSLPRTTKS